MRQNLKDEIAAHIRNLILSGELRPGEKILQDQVALDLAVSRLPVREALIALESEGLVKNIPRKGSYVAMLKPEDVIDHFIVFGMLSGLAAERAANRLTADQFDQLERLVEEMDRETDPMIQENLNGQFHEIINRAGSSLRLRSLLRGLAKSIPSKFFEMPTGWSDWARSDHKAIIDALRSRDGRAAAELMQQHLRNGGEAAVRGLRGVGFWAD